MKSTHRDLSRRFTASVPPHMSRCIMTNSNFTKLVSCKLVYFHIFYSSHATFLTQQRGAHENNVYIEDRRPTDLAYWKTSNDHMLATGHPIRFIFGSRVGFSRSADRMDLLLVGPNPRWRLAAIFENLKWPYLWNGSSDRLRV